MNPLLYLVVRGFVNSLKRGLRTPRVFVPALFILLALGAMIVPQVLLYQSLRGHGQRHTRRHVRRTPPAGYGQPGNGDSTGGTRAVPGIAPPFTSTEMTQGGPGALTAAVRALLLLNILTAAVGALGESNLFFSQSDIDFQFPAPLRRRSVLFFKMFGRYLRLLLPAVYIPFVVGSESALRSGVTFLAYWPGLVGSWLFLIATTNITQAILINRADRSEADDNSPASQRRARFKSVLTVARNIMLFGFLAVIFYTFSTLGSGQNAVGLATYWQGALRVINSHAATALLQPIAWASDLYQVAFLGWHMADAGRLGGLVLLCAASFAFLFSRERDFYEGSLEISARMTRTVTAMRSGDAGSFQTQMAREGKLVAGRSLRSFGGGAWAILWKDAVSITRFPLRAWLTLLFFAAFPAVFSLLFGQSRDGASILIWLFMFTITMSGTFLLSLRDMLRRADISKAFPLHPAAVLGAELALSIVQLVVLGWLSLTIMVVTRVAHGPLVAVAYLTLPTLAALLLFVQSSFVLLYPNQNDAAQNGISGLFGLLASVFSLLPGVAIGVGLTLTGVPPLLMGLAVAGINTIAAVAALFFATFLWQRFDPTN